MTYRFINPAGREIQVEGEAELRDAVLQGRLGPDTLMFERESGRWVRASLHPAYQRAANSDTGSARGSSDATTAGREEAASGHREDAAGPGRGGSAGSEAEASTGFWIAQGAAVLIVVINGVAISPANPWEETLGFALGHMVGMALFSALFLVWNKRSRPFIPFAMLAVSVITSINTGGYDRPSSGSDQMLDEMEAVIDRIEQTHGLWHLGEDAGAGTAEAARPQAPAPTGSVDDRFLWAITRILEDYETLNREYEASYGLEDIHLEGWLEPHYFANASRYPEVPRYLERNRAAVRDMEETFDRMIIERSIAIMDQANLPPRAREEFEGSFLQSFRNNAPRRQEMWALLERWISVAEQFHQALVENESVIRVSPDLGIAEILDPSVEGVVLELYADLQRTTERIADLQDEIMSEMRGRIAEGRRILR